MGAWKLELGMGVWVCEHEEDGNRSVGMGSWIASFFVDPFFKKSRTLLVQFFYFKLVYIYGQTKVQSKKRINKSTRSPIKHFLKVVYPFRDVEKMNEAFDWSVLQLCLPMQFSNLGRHELCIYWSCWGHLLLFEEGGVLSPQVGLPIMGVKLEVTWRQEPWSHFTMSC